MIRVGIGGWVFPPWRGEFYPKDLPQARELEYASRRVTTIEINSTFYRTQKRESFRKWAEETPADFVFSVKAPRFATHRRVLAQAGESIERFFESGVMDLDAKLGPILWQMHPFKKFEEEDFAAFLQLLPPRMHGTALRHVVEVRHASFVDAKFVELLRTHSVAAALVHSDKHPLIADLTADFIYARLEGTSAKIKTGYPPAVLDQWAQRAKTWTAGNAPGDLPLIGGKAPKKPRDVFIYMIAGAKVRAPAAATALLDRLNQQNAVA
jgi:uncharacterized protein YecE (DUF72 family)